MRYTLQTFSDDSRIIRLNDEIAALMTHNTGGWLVTDVRARTDRHVANEQAAWREAIDIAHRDSLTVQEPAHAA